VRVSQFLSNARQTARLASIVDVTRNAPPNTPKICEKMGVSQFLLIARLTISIDYGFTKSPPNNSPSKLALQSSACRRQVANKVGLVVSKIFSCVFYRQKSGEKRSKP
jgi:hypothetical protein